MTMASRSSTMSAESTSSAKGPLTPRFAKTRAMIMVELMAMALPAKMLSMAPQPRRRPTR